MKRFFISLLLCSVFTALSAQLSIRVVQIPANTPLSDTIFIVGNFNNWDPGDVNYQLTKALDGTYEIDINPSPGELKFKFTRGDWSRVEGNANGGYRPDRTFSYDGTAQVLELSILSWEGLGNGTSTAAANVSILDEAFFIPQLNRNRRIWLYLPPEDLSIQYALNIYPNPGEDFLIIDKESIAAPLHLQLYDGSGKLLVEKWIIEQHQKVELPALPTAPYFIQIKENNRLIFSEKWIRN